MQGMPPSNDSALALADQLRSLTDPELVALLDERGVTPGGIRDFFDLADSLLRPESVEAALARTQRPALIALGVVAELGVTTIADAAARLSALGGDPGGLEAQLDIARALALLSRSDGLVSVAPPVAARLAALRLDALVAEPAPPAPRRTGRSDRERTERAAAMAFETTSLVAELVAELHREPVRELARGGVTLPDSRRVAASIGVDVDRVPALLEIGERAGLIARSAEGRIAAEPASAWLAAGPADRWSDLAAGWLERLPGDVRGILRDRASVERGADLEAYLSWLYPLGGAPIRDRLAVHLRDAELLGIASDGVPSIPGSLLITAGPAAARAAMGARFPSEVDRVYLLDDLSVLSPGPLAPAIEARLRGIAEFEGGVLAPSYRVTTASLYRAMASGETADTIRRFLGEISLAGVPQPLDYLIAEAAARFGLVRVAERAGGGSAVRSVDAGILRTLLVDSTLAPLGLTRSGDGLSSRFGPPVVFWSLAGARYPVAAEDADGRIVPLERPRRSAPTTATRPDPLVGLVERLRAGSPTDAAAADRAWLARQLDVAVRDKLGLTVTVTLPDGRSASYELEPASVAGGRLRARDRRGDLERTLPLSSITAVGPASGARGS